MKPNESSQESAGQRRNAFGRLILRSPALRRMTLRSSVLRSRALRRITLRSSVLRSPALPRITLRSSVLRSPALPRITLRSKVMPRNNLRSKLLRRFFWPVGALILVLTLWGAAAWIAPQATAAGQAPAPTLQTPVSNVDQYFIQGLRQALSSPRLNAADRQLLQKKLEYTERLEAQRAAAPATRGPKGPLAAPVPMPLPLQPPPAQPEERILAGTEGMLHSWEASITNRWEGLYRAVPTQVFAGSAADNPAQGLLIVMVYPIDTGQPLRRTYPAPTPNGSLRIVARQGDLLRCEAADGSILFFNLATRAFQP